LRKDYSVADDIFDPFANKNKQEAADTEVSEIELDPASSLLADSDSNREFSLSTNFEDPSALLAELSNDASPSLVQETIDAVQELVFDPADKAEKTPVFDLQTDSAVAIAPASEEPQLIHDASTWHAAKAEMADKFFSLILCEYTFEALTEEVLKILVQAVDAEAGSILEMDHQTKEFFFRASIGGGDKNKIKSFRVPCNKGIVGHVAESKNSYLVNDLEDSEMQLKSISMATGFEAKSCIAAPIFITNQLFGVVEVFNRKGINYFDNRDVALLEDGIRMASKVLELRFFLATLWKHQNQQFKKAA